MNTHYRSHEQGGISGSIVAIVGLSLLVVVFGGFGVWSFMNYNEQKTNVDTKIADAAAAARLEQADKDEQDFAKREKQPLRQFVGPSDYGRLTFDYPKTWSAYQATDISEGGGVTYEAYLNPIQVPPVGDKQKFALRITIEQKIYDKALDSYATLIKKGDLKSSVYNDGIHTGTKIEGNFNKDIYGTAVLIKMRDRTLTVRTDGDVFKADYEAILKTIKFNE
jgi:hypothetical protein